MMKAFIKRFVLGTSESSKFKIVVKEHSNGRCPWGMYENISSFVHLVDTGCTLRRIKYTCIAWASALLVSTTMGNARASRCGTSSDKDSHAFFVCGNIIKESKLRDRGLPDIVFVYEKMALSCVVCRDRCCNCINVFASKFKWR